MSDIGFGPVGDPPIVNHYPLKDGYGRKTPLVDRRLLEQAQARIAELERERDNLVETKEDLARRLMDVARAISVDIGLTVGGRGIIEAIHGLAAERDHWRAEAEKARTRFNDLWAIYDATDGVTPDASNPEHLRFAADIVDQVAPNDALDPIGLRAYADRLESEATADRFLPTVEESHQLDNATLDRIAGHFGIEVPDAARRPEDTADDVVEKAELRANHTSWCPLHQNLTPHSGDQCLPCFDAAGLLRGDR